jgi:HD-GYP domain-containing protein (c-di-GMP phosphodiesterase class II)
MDFTRKALIRIMVSGTLIGILAGFVGWYIAVEGAEREAVDLAAEVSIETIDHYQLTAVSHDNATLVAKQVTDNLIFDWFDIVELYDAAGMKLAESLTEEGEAIENQIPSHKKPSYNEASYQRMELDSGAWALRIFIPIMQGAKIWGYMEGVRVVPEWQRNSISQYAMWVALIAAGAAWLCAIVIYPLVVFLSREHVRQSEAIRAGNLDMMLTLGKAIALRDSDTGAHNYRVAWLAIELAEAVKFSADRMRALLLGSYLHDVGKIAISDNILLKPGRLTDEEMEIMKTHVMEGGKMVDQIPWLEDARSVIEYHHEKWDGSGYPRGLSAEEIPLSARIFAIVDVFDALCSKRPYKEPFSYQAALNIILDSKGSHFDPDLVSHFETIAPRLYEVITKADESECKRLMTSKIDAYFYR